MRFMVIVKATPLSETGAPPAADAMEKMGAFNKEMVDAGVMLAGEGLKASKFGARIAFSDGGAAVTDGPFAETKELIAGFWLLSVKSKDDVIAWMRRAPFEPGNQLEIRQISEIEDFSESMTPEHLERITEFRERTGRG